VYSPTHYYVRVSGAETFTGRSLASQAGALTSQAGALSSQAGALLHRPEPWERWMLRVPPPCIPLDHRWGRPETRTTPRGKGDAGSDLASAGLLQGEGLAGVSLGKGLLPRIRCWCRGGTLPCTALGRAWHRAYPSQLPAHCFLSR
jgi:hypothetical protein